MPIRKAGILLILVAFPLLASAGTGPRISFDKESRDYGKVLYGDKLDGEFHFTNTGGQTLVIEKLRSSCGCTKKRVKGGREAPPGAKGTIETIFDTDGMRPGAKKKYIYVHSNDPERPVVKLTLLAHVIRHVNISPPIITKKMPRFEGSVAFPMKISNTSKNPVTVKGIQIKESDLTVAMSPKRLLVKPGADASFDILLTKKKGPIRYFHSGRIVLLTDYPRQKEILIRYFLQVGDPIKKSGEAKKRK